MKVWRGLSVHLLYCQAGVSAPTKKIDIFCMMMSRSDRQYPMTIVVLSSAKIFQLIGLICWQYTIEGRQPPLRFPSLVISYLPYRDRKNIHLAVISRRYYFTPGKKVKGKGFPYSIPSVGPGADPGVQAVSPQVTVSHPPGGRLALLSARPAVTSPAAEHQVILLGDRGTKV